MRCYIEEIVQLLYPIDKLYRLGLLTWYYY